MSDDENKKKDEVIETESNSTEEVKEEVAEDVVETKAEEKEEVVEEPKTEEVVSEPVAEPTPEEPTATEEHANESAEPVVEEPKVEEPKVEVPDQVVNTYNENSNNNNNNNNDNNDNYSSNYQQTTSNNVNQNQAQAQTSQTQSEKKGMAIFALILSILAFFTSIFLVGGLFGFISIILSIVVLAKKKGGKGMAITALILSILSMFGALIGALVILPILGVMGLGIATYSNASKTISDGYDYYTNVVEDIENDYDFNEIEDIFGFNFTNSNTTTSSNSTTTNSVSSNTTRETNTTSSSNTVSNTISKSTSTSGISLGNYTVKYGNYEGDAAASGETLVLKENGTGTYNGKSCTWSKGTHDFAQDSSTRGSIKDCIIIKTSEGNYYLYASSSSTLTDGDITIFNYVG